MKQRRSAFTILTLIILLMVGLVSVAAMQPDSQALIQVPWRSQIDRVHLETVGVPVYVRLTGADGPFLLAGASPGEVQALRDRGLDVHILDPDVRGANYYLAYVLPGRARPEWSAYGRLLLDGGGQALLRATPSDAERLALAGVELRAITFDPKPLGPAPVEGAIPTAVTPDPFIQVMIDQVDQATVYDYTGGLSGEWPVDIGGSPYTIATRHTTSGTPIQKATRYVGEHLAALGLDVEYHQWGGATYPNVIGELAGLTNPDDIFIIGGHLDDMPPGSLAPGADDNAGGSVATLIAADILTQYQWGCTLRFALWTGEEQGLLGSAAYAQRAHDGGENIVGYLNLDMIAWNTGATNPTIDLHANSGLPQTLVLAQLFADVVDAYDLNLIPEIVPNGSGASDHASFWTYGYTSIMGIEDFSDFNPYYHTTNDDMDNFQDWPYYVEFVKASVGTFAHLSDCLIHGGIGSLAGYVTSASDGAPLADVEMAMNGRGDPTFRATTDGAGYYSRTLIADTYTVTVAVDGYLPAVITDVVVLSDTVTTQNIALQPIPIVEVEPSSLEATLYADSSVTETLWLTNSGKADLEFFLHEVSQTLTLARLEYDTPWLSENPVSGTVAPGEGVSVAVTFDSTGLEPDLYLGFLDVESNDPATPSPSVPVTLIVRPPCVPLHDVDFYWEPITPTVGQDIRFYGAAAGEEPFSFQWDLGDGHMGSGASVVHAYLQEDVYTVTMTATNNCGLEVVSDTLAVDPLPCDPAQIVTVTEEISGCVVTFDAELGGTPPYTYSWDFGVFGLSAKPNPTVDFTAFGTYPYSLTVFNCSGLYSDTLSGTVAVDYIPPSWYVYLPLVRREGEPGR